MNENTCRSCLPAALVLWIVPLGCSRQADEPTLADFLDLVRQKQFVDLTHAFEPGIPHWPGFPDEQRLGFSCPGLCDPALKGRLRCRGDAATATPPERVRQDNHRVGYCASTRSRMGSKTLHKGGATLFRPGSIPP
jgi:hypothetical protein